MKKLTLLFMLGMLAGVVSAQTKVSPQLGGTGQDSSHSTGCASVSGGVWSFSPANCGGGGGGGTNPSQVGAQNWTGSAWTALPTIYAQNYSGDAVSKIQACNDAVVALGGGTCDASAVLPPSTEVTGTTQLSVGDHASGLATVRMIFPPQFNLRVTLNDATKCAVRVYNRAWLDGGATPAGGTRGLILPGSGSTMRGLLCTDTSDSLAQNYIRINGVSALNDNGSTMNYAVDIEDLGDQSVYSNSYANNPSGNTMLIGNVCCGMQVSGIQAFGSNISGTPNSTGGTALTLGGYGYISIYNSSFNRPKNGFYNIDIQGNWQLVCFDCYGEGNGATDGVTPMVRMSNLSTGTAFFGGEMNPCVACVQSGKPSFINNSGYDYIIEGLKGGNLPGNTMLQDTASGLNTCLSAGEGNIAAPCHGGPNASYILNLGVNTETVQMLNAGPTTIGVSSGIPLQITNTLSGFPQLGTWYGPNTTAGQGNFWTQGVNNSANNNLNFIFNYISSGSTSNNEQMAVGGSSTNGLRIYGNGGVSVGSTTVPPANGLRVEGNLVFNGTCTGTGCGGGGGGISGLTAGYIPLAGSATTLTANSHIDDGVTTAATLTATEPLAINASGNGIDATEGTAPSGVASHDILYPDSTAHRWAMKNNNGAAQNVVGLIASGTSALGTSAIASAACATVVTTAATGAASTDAIIFTPNASIKAVTGYTPATTGGLSISAYATANNVNFDVCNWSNASITPGAVTLNWVVVR